MIKDAGDEPDPTNGLEIQALVERISVGEIVLLGGEGVGVATLPGLPVAVGEAAINPGPRRLIRQVIQETLKTLNAKAGAGFKVTIQVPEGERVAAQTVNPRLGIVGGISILGTDGLVRSSSVPAFRANIFYALNVARKTGYTTVGLATGKRSAAYLRTYLQDDRGLGVVDAGDELGYPLRQAQRFGFERVTLGGIMLSEFSKVAQGRLQTYVDEGEVDFDFLAEVAAGQGAPDGVCRRIRTARTAHQVQGWLRKVGLQIEPELARRAAQQAGAAVGGLPVEVLIFSLDGELLGQAGPACSQGETR